MWLHAVRVEITLRVEKITLRVEIILRVGSLCGLCGLLEIGNKACTSSIKANGLTVKSICTRTRALSHFRLRSPISRCSSHFVKSLPIDFPIQQRSVFSVASVSFLYLDANSLIENSLMNKLMNKLVNKLMLCTVRGKA